uniref:Uncharacterized protein n=2 Tax=viral metagenome TaxID=1070528 RepID=A0A6M3JE65_9ZZZZ
MNVDQIIRIIESCPAGTNLTINIGVTVNVGEPELPPEVPDLPDPDPDPPAPPTRLVVVTNAQACIKPVGNDETGKPIMEHTIVGFRVEVGEAYQVETPPVVASGGDKYYCIWRGEQDDVSRRGWYILKDNTKAL